MIMLRTDRLVLRNWRDSDRSLFHEINADPEVMRYFPARRSRAEADALMDAMRDGIATTGFGFYVMELQETGEPIGFCGLNRVAIDGVFPEGTVEIGWRLARRFWSRGYVSEAARALLRYGFEERGLDTIVSFAVHDNARSTAVMERIGMERRPERDFDHPKVPDSHPHLKPHVVYALTAEQWRKRPTRPRT